MIYKNVILGIIILAMVILTSCDDPPDVQGEINVLGNTAKFEIKKRARTFETSGTVGADGVIKFTYGGEVVEFSGYEPGSEFTVKIDDPWVAQVPSEWEYISGSWMNPSPESGIITATAASSFDPSFSNGPFIGEPGMQLLFLYSPTNVTNDTVETVATVDFDTNGINDGVELKALDVALVYCYSPSGQPVEVLEVTEGLGVDFSNLPPDHVLTPGYTGIFQSNSLCINDGGEYFVTSIDHSLPNNGGGKYFPSFTHCPAQSIGTPNSWPWKISGWEFTGMQGNNFGSTWVWKSCLQKSTDLPYSTTMTFPYPSNYINGSMAHSGPPAPLYSDVIPSTVPIVSGLGYLFPSTFGGFDIYMNIFATAAGSWVIPSTAPYYSWRFAFVGASGITVPSGCSIWEFVWENQGPYKQFLSFSGSETDCTGYSGGNKGKNYSLGSEFDNSSFYYWNNSCTGGEVEWDMCLHVDDAVSIPVNKPGTGSSTNPFATYGFDVGSATVTPYASSNSAYLQVMTEDQCSPPSSPRVLLAAYAHSQPKTIPYGTKGYRLPHSWDMFTDVFASLTPVWAHQLNPGYPSSMFGTTTGGHSIAVPIDASLGLQGLELCFSTFSQNGLYPSASFMVTYF